jgi:GT2 family glycosyltransferase
VEKKDLEIFSLKKELSNLKIENLGMRDAIQGAIADTKLIHLLGRIKNQFFRGNKSEKKEFVSWLFRRSPSYTDGDHRFQPLYSVYDRLENALKLTEMQKIELNDQLENRVCFKIDQNIHLLGDDFLSIPYKKYDVIFFSIIDYGFRFQRPQQFARRFALDGHRTFFINSIFSSDHIKLIEENLYEITLKNILYPSIYETDWQENSETLIQKLDELINLFKIRDSVIIIEYPNWIEAATYLRLKYGFKIVTDYLDDFTGFLNSSEQLITENCEKMLQSSDGIISSSSFLSNIANKYAKCPTVIIRNGTEFQHFNTAAIREKQNEKPIIGYYGAIAHWFDVQKIEYLSANLRNAEIQLIGSVTENKERLSSLPNVKLFGEIPYKELPKYLSKFDICLVPFRTDIDLIKATNPVIFYEYLSAGKKIVATEIPELEPYNQKFVYLANDDQDFLNYVTRCIDRTDSLCSSTEAIEFAKLQDWNIRFEELTAFIQTVTPSVEIIVLTYNGLEINKLCLTSILEKTAYPNFSVTLVDNDSSDGTKEWLRQVQLKRNNRINVIFNNSNLGFAAGNNVAFKASKADYVILLNNDTLVTRGWITSLIKHLENDPGLGMCGSVTNAIGNEARIPVNYSTTQEMDIFADRYTFENMGKQWRDPRALAFFCAAIRKSITDECGFLDESYSIGMFEDDDYAEAVRAHGYRLAIAEDSFIHHFENYSFNKLDKAYKQEIFVQNKNWYETKWNKSWVPHVYRESVDYSGSISKLK